MDIKTKLKLFEVLAGILMLIGFIGSWYTTFTNGCTKIESIYFGIFAIGGIILILTDAAYIVHKIKR
jgi:hypothetical protein